MRVGVTGSTGLIGTAVVAALERRGDTVVRFLRPSSRPTTGEHIRWDPGTGDVDTSDLQRVGGLDGIVHLAGTGIADHRWSTSYRSLILTSRVTSTKLVVDVAQQLGGISTLVSGSAIGFYGSRGDEILTEQSTSGADYVAEVCREWERPAVALRASGTAVTLARTGIVMSTKGGALGKLLPLFQWGLGGQLGNGRQWMAPISITDEVRALLFALDQRLDGPVNLVAPAPCTNAELTKTLAGSLHRPRFARVPALAMSAVLGRECAAATVLSSQRVVPSTLLEAGFTFTSNSIHEIIPAVLSARD